MRVRRIIAAALAAGVLCGCAGGQAGTVVAECEPQAPAPPDVVGGERVCIDRERPCAGSGTIIHQPRQPKPVCSRGPRTPKEQ